MLAIVFDSHAFPNSQSVSDTGSNSRRNVKMNRVVACPRQPKSRALTVVACGRRLVVASGNPGILPKPSPRSALVAVTQGHWKIRARTQGKTGIERSMTVWNGCQVRSPSTPLMSRAVSSASSQVSSRSGEELRTCSVCTEDSSPNFSRFSRRNVSPCLRRPQRPRPVSSRSAWRFS